jgi:uncharacterized membrane protein
MVDLGDNMPLGINRDGAMAGINLVSERAVLIQGDAVTDLGTLGGRRSAAHGLNAKTTVVGDAEAEIVPEDEQAPSHAFVWTEADGMRALAEPPNGNWSLAHAINDNGVIAGNTRVLADDGSTVYMAVRWVNGSPQVLASDPVDAKATTINKAGVTGGSLNHAAVIWRPSGTMLNLGTFGYPEASVVDINDRQVALVVTYQDLFPHNQTRTCKGGQCSSQLPPVPGSYDCAGTALNNSTVIVGQCTLNETPPSQIPVVGAVWVDGIAYDLNSVVDNLGSLQITKAWDVNDSGEIAALAQAGETQFGVLLIPQ